MCICIYILLVHKSMPILVLDKPRNSSQYIANSEVLQSKSKREHAYTFDQFFCTNFCFFHTLCGMKSHDHKRTSKHLSHSVWLKNYIMQFSIRNSSLISKVESLKLAGTLDSCFVLFGTLQQCAPTEPGRNRTRDRTVRKPVSNRCATSARSRLEFLTSPINDIARIIQLKRHYSKFLMD